MKKDIQLLELEIKAVKKQILALGVLRPGSLSTQYYVCKRAGCRCMASPPLKHGPYNQLSFTRKGKSSTRLVKPHEMEAVQSHLDNYRQLRNLVDKLIDLNTMLSDLQLRTIKGPENKLK